MGAAAMTGPRGAGAAQEPQLCDKIAVITGSSSGIGRAIALRFAAAGAKVVLSDRQEAPREGGPTTQSLVADAGGSATYAEGDVTDPSYVQSLFDAAASLGGTDVLVNCAGILRRGAFLEFTEDDYDALMSVNVKASFFVAQAAARQMSQSGRGGSIINLSSLAGLKGSTGLAGYCTSKGAVRLMTMAMAAELGAAGIRVNALHPGLIDTALNRIDVPVLDTPMGDEIVAGIPLQRAASPDDVADAALYLASAMSSYVTGASLVVDGGMFRG
jgi:NAD(P)-dependent dehydrogenase (short-subunit alcohol dehydrogenase family)